MIKKNPSKQEIIYMVQTSKHRALRRLVDHATGDAWYWPAELATHAEMAEKLNIPYDRPPGQGDIVTD